MRTAKDAGRDMTKAKTAKVNPLNATMFTVYDPLYQALLADQSSAFFACWRDSLILPRSREGVQLNYVPWRMGPTQMLSAMHYKLLMPLR
jgi:hypothetical protein